jgi:hypothetical protein
MDPRVGLDNLPGCDAVELGRYSQKFRRNVLLPSSVPKNIYFLDLVFGRKDGSNVFLRNFSELLTEYMVAYPEDRAL